MDQENPFSRIILSSGHILHGPDRKSFEKGWAVGHFEKALLRTNLFEIKDWYYNESPEYGIKGFDGEGEFIIVEGGKLEITLITNVSGAEHRKAYTLSHEDRAILIIPVGFQKIVRCLVTPSWGITVRWPSFPGVNKVIEAAK